MIELRRISIFTILLFSLWSCSKDPSPSFESLDEHAAIYQELLSMEYNLLVQDYDQVILHTKKLDELLSDGYNLFCPYESAKIDGARFTNRMFAQHVERHMVNNLLDDLRILKGIIINLETNDDYDPYFLFLWQFEEDMYVATQIAMDPMLDLYEWNEFNAFAECMEDSWQKVKMHFPSPEMFNNDPTKFKLQSVSKIKLEKALEHFKQAVVSADYEKYPLCESAENLQKAYIQYIKTFIQPIKRPSSFLAKL